LNEDGVVPIGTLTLSDKGWDEFLRNTAEVASVVTIHCGVSLTGNRKG